jgi:phage head maturation protease
MTSLPAPLLEPGAITTLIAPPDSEGELAALTLGIAVAYRSGYPIVPDFAPVGPAELTLYCFAGSWIDWRCLAGDIANAAGIPFPSLRIQCFSDPMVQAVAAVEAKRDPDAATFWNPYTDRDLDADLERASAAGYELPSHLTVIFGLEGAAGPGDGVRQLYESLRDSPALIAGTEANVADIAGEYGPVIALPDMHNSVSWRDLLARVTGGDMPEEDQVERDFAPAEDVHLPSTTNLRTPASVVHLNGSPILYGYGAVTNQWHEVNSRLQGRYLERFAKGAFAKAAESMARMKVCFEHGKNPDFGFQALGPLTVLEEDDYGLFFEVPLLNAEHARRLMPGLLAGELGSSITYEVVTDDLVKNPGCSAFNPESLPELTVREARVSELGPCRHPAFAGTTAGIRCAAD